MIELVCSHQRGDAIVLCCVAQTEDGRAIAFQINARDATGDPTDSAIFENVDAARRLWRESTWPHA